MLDDGQDCQLALEAANGLWRVNLDETAAAIRMDGGGR
jgi:hypothetical protein